MGIAVGDYDCDGWFDIFKTNFEGDACNRYHSSRDGTLYGYGVYSRCRRSVPVRELGRGLYGL